MTRCRSWASASLRCRSARTGCWKWFERQKQNRVPPHLTLSPQGGRGGRGAACETSRLPIRGAGVRGGNRGTAARSRDRGEAARRRAGAGGGAGNGAGGALGG